MLGKGLKVLLMKALGWVFKRLSLGRQVRRGVALSIYSFYFICLFCPRANCKPRLSRTSSETVSVGSETQNKKRAKKKKRVRN